MIRSKCPRRGCHIVLGGGGDDLHRGDEDDDHDDDDDDCQVDRYFDYEQRLK